MATETGLVIPVEAMQAALRRTREQAQPIADEAVSIAAENIVSHAQFNSPIKTGVLKDSHGVTEVRNGKADMYANTDYALAVHSKNPWFMRAIAEVGVRSIEGGLEIALQRAADRIGGGR